MTTEKLCNQCGDMKPVSAFSKQKSSKDGLRWQCKACDAGYMKRWRADHCAEVAVYNGRYRTEHREEAVSYGKEYREEHREELLAYFKQYNTAHRREKATWHAAHREENREKRAAYNRQWSEENREKEAAGSQRRRARKMAVTIEDFDVMEVWERDGEVCTYCGSTEDLTLDHVVPLSRGGTHALANLRVACRSCNSSKGAKELDEWIPWQTMLPCELHRKGVAR